MPKVPIDYSKRRQPDRSGSKNPNWKGGISQFKISDHLLDLGLDAQNEIKRQLLSHIAIDEVTKCWNWTGNVFPGDGRACLSLGYKRHLAYRLSYVLYKGKTGPLNVCHTCDNVICINPDHLWLGTNRDNSRDMVAKGRSLDQKGSKNHVAKLTEDDVKLIKARLRAGVTQYRLSCDYGVSKQTICFIAHNVTWRHVN